MRNVFVRKTCVYGVWMIMDCSVFKYLVIAWRGAWECTKWSHSVTLGWYTCLDPSHFYLPNNTSWLQVVATSFFFKNDTKKFCPLRAADDLRQRFTFQKKFSSAINTDVKNYLRWLFRFFIFTKQTREDESKEKFDTEEFLNNWWKNLKSWRKNWWFNKQIE